MAALQFLIFVPLLSLLPCMLWLWYFASRSRYKRLSFRVLGLTVLFGVLATIPALILNQIGKLALVGLLGESHFTQLVFFVLIVGPVEEGLKLLAVYFYAYRRPEFDEPLDGVVYGAAAALGFAAIENVLYLARNNPLMVLLRGPLSNPGHALFSAIWGMSLSRAKAKPNLFSARFPVILQGWLYASLLHSLFDVLIGAASRVSLLFFGVLVAQMIALFFWVRARIIFHRDTSPHREGTMVLPTHRYCNECGSKGTSGMRCPKCSAFIPESEELELCPICATLQRPGAKFCARCGANIKLPAKENLDSRPHFVTITAEGDERIAYILNENEILIGRTLNNGFVIEHPSVSKRHARVVAEADEYALYDLGSSNGTFVNGKRVNETKLEDGCEVRFGRAHFIYRSQVAHNDY